MQNEFSELLDSALYKEIASEALYTAMKDRTLDPGASALMAELADEEKKHVRWLTEFKDKGSRQRWRSGVVADLRIGEHLSSADTVEGAGLQDTLVFAMKKEQQAVDFYSRMTGALRSRTAKRLCQKLVNEELRHKLKLELMYDELFLGED
jgi:rubrerythrin